MVILHIKHLNFPFVLRPFLGEEIHRITFLQQGITLVFFILNILIKVVDCHFVPPSQFFHTFPFKNPLDVIGCFSVHEFLIQPNHNRLLCPIDYQLPRFIRIVAKKTLCTHFVLPCLKPSADSPCAVL